MEVRMTTRTEARPEYPMDEEEMRYWARRGPKAAFLLVIPGCTIMGLGIGLLQGQPVPLAVTALGAGLLIWGLIVALTK
jgi:uncharacterized membrane protein YedE/YeeE